MTRCHYCKRPAWFQDQATGFPLCPVHSRLRVCAADPETRPRRPQVSWLIRPAGPADQSAILKLWKHFWSDDGMDCFDRDYRAVKIPHLLACQGEQIVGLLGYAVEREWDAINIVVLNVLPSHQGRGGARGLIAALEKEACRTGIGRLIVATSNDNVAALYFYQRLGFQITGIEVGAIEPDEDDEHLVGVGGIPVRDEIRLEKRL